MAKGGGGSRGVGGNALTAGSATPPGPVTGSAGAPPTVPGTAAAQSTPQGRGLIRGNDMRLHPYDEVAYYGGSLNGDVAARDPFAGASGTPQGVVTVGASKSGKVPALPAGTGTAGTVSGGMDPAAMRAILAQMMSGGGYFRPESHRMSYGGSERTGYTTSGRMAGNYATPGGNRSSGLLGGGYLA